MMDQPDATSCGNVQLVFAGLPEDENDPPRLFESCDKLKEEKQ
jgi:hypothetical protein